MCRAIFCVIAILSPPFSPLNVKSTMEVGFDYNIGMGNLEVCDKRFSKCFCSIKEN